mmetsp:Transcript_32794/g.45542  ORF Transcript_32794/g.45542 Transcript_32794/m.45542 type:complete len:167 (+) Transcript_32794:44-544(+)|eukprot:CAMPEP_0196586452 /NCGR_PEP_ID=MMETSP1081-20130531/54338_1 /TAXON_ID=36882 /ORGANISM="Pyramimonas amylifera, Strain CCMP720" /LENGTH=166 /DNA_ID=CAMNT_0041908339 /DNA_START=44 /DNA_END=544 /DNA_ORIENTATION=+
MDRVSIETTWKQQCEREEVEVCLDVERRRQYNKTVKLSPFGTIIVPVGASKSSYKGPKHPGPPPTERAGMYGVVGGGSSDRSGNFSSRPKSDLYGAPPSSLRDRAPSEKSHSSKQSYPSEPKFSVAESEMDPELLSRLDKLERDLMEEMRRRKAAERDIASLQQKT